MDVWVQLLVLFLLNKQKHGFLLFFHCCKTIFFTLFPTSLKHARIVFHVNECLVVIPTLSHFVDDLFLFICCLKQECSIGEAETPNYGSPDEMFSKDLNPCLTPCIAKSKSDVSAQFQSSSQFTKVNPFSCHFLASSPKRLDISFLSCTSCICQESSSSHRSSGKGRGDRSYSSFGRPMSKSSDHHKPTSGTSNKRRVYKSDQDKINQNLF